MQTYWSRKQLEALGETIGLELPSRINGRVGGGGKSAPAAPDYTAAAKATAESNATAMATQTQANRPNIVTPFGTQSWQNNPTFDQTGYDAAMAKYNASAIPGTAGHYETVGGGGDGGDTTQQWVNGTEASNPSGPAPDRSAFSSPNWTQTTTLTPAMQKSVDSQQAIQQGRSDAALGLMPQMQAAVNTPIDKSAMQSWGAVPTLSNFKDVGAAPTLSTSLDRSGIPAMPGEDNAAFVQKYVDKANSFAQPQNQLDQSNLDAKLAGMGLTPGSAAYNNAQRTLADQQSRNEFNAINTGMNQSNQMYVNNLAANNQGFNQALQSGQFSNNAKTSQNQMELANTGFNNNNAATSYNQQLTNANYANTLRQAQWSMAQQEQLQPLNVMNALLNGQQVSMPNMPSFSQAGNSGGVNYSQAANNQYQADLGASNASNASSAGLASGLFSMGGMALGGPLGGMAGKGLASAFGFGS